MQTQKLVVAALIINEGKVLLAKRPSSKKIGPGKFHLPGGHVEFGETLQQALEREIREELGIRIEAGEPFFSFSYAANNGASFTIGLVLNTKLLSKSDEIRLTADTEQVAWASESELTEFFDADDYNLKAAEAGLQNKARMKLGGSNF